MPELNQLIALASKDVKFGELIVRLQIHDGQPKALEGDEHSQKNYSGDGTATSIEDALAALARERVGGNSGKITFTFDFKSGQVKRLFVHRQIKHLLTGK